jgi:hypothetical protein
MRPSIKYLQVSAWSVRAATDHRPDLQRCVEYTVGLEADIARRMSPSAPK